MQLELVVLLSLWLQLTDANTVDEINSVMESEEFERLQVESGSVRLPTVSSLCLGCIAYNQIT